tara:strand:- start:243 stop:536 length:294 start_codon:yes stop_codon:yes gene_type:complete
MKKLVDGKLIDMTAEEIAVREAEEKTWNDGALDRALNDLRKDRNKLLADSDWEVTMAKEKGTNLSSAFKTWRQELRDITEGLTTVEEVEGVEFPEKP